MPWLTVVVPAYNRANLLEVCLTSLGQQSCPDWECIIVDDGSTDHTPAVAQRFAEADTRFVYQQQRNAGVSAARNAGLARARGEWIAFLDSDDFYFRGAVEQLMQASRLCRQRGLAPRIICGQLVTSGEEPAPPGASSPLRLRDLFFRALNFTKKGRTPLLQNTIFHRSTLLAMEDGFCTSLPTSEDREFLIRATAASDVVLVQPLISHYRTDHGLGKSDQFRAGGGKVRAHREIYLGLDRANVIRQKLASSGRHADFERLRQAYLSMLDAVELAAAGQGQAAAEHLQQADDLCQQEEERAALVQTFSYFFRFPASQPHVAFRRSLRMLALVGSHLSPAAAIRRTVDALIRSQGEHFLPGYGRHTFWPAPTSSGEVAGSMPAIEDAADPAAAAQTRFVVRPLNMASLPGGRALVHLQDGTRLSMPAEVAAAIRACTAFRTIEQHAQLAVVGGRCRLEDQKVVEQALEGLAARGGLLSVEEALRDGRQETVPRQQIACLGIEVDGALALDGATLESFVDNAARHGHHPAIFALDPTDSEEPEQPNEVLRRRLLEIGRRFGVSVRYVGARERRAQCELLSAEAALPPALVALALGIDGQGGPGRRLSGSLNGMLLDRIGSPVMIVRAGSRCRPARLPNQRPGLFITGAAGFVRTLSFESRAALEGHLVLDDLDLLGTHEEYLGVAPGALVARQAWSDIDVPAAELLSRGQSGRPYLAATMSSAYGALGEEDPTALLLARDTGDPRLLLNPEVFRRTLRHESAWRGVPEVTVSRVGAFDLSATALCNRAGRLPPMLPFLDTPEGVFGWTAALVDDDARSACLPVAVNLEIQPPADREAPVPGGQANPWDFHGLVEACLLTYTRPVGAREPAELMVSVGRHLGGLARLPREDLLVVVRPIVCGWLSEQLRTLEELLTAHGDEPAPWANEARGAIDRLLSHVVSDGPLGEQDWPLFDEQRRRLVLCGQLFEIWPELLQAADRIRKRGSGEQINSLAGT
jgi:hypothetical protein